MLLIAIISRRSETGPFVLSLQWAVGATAGSGLFSWFFHFSLPGNSTPFPSGNFSPMLGESSRFDKLQCLILPIGVKLWSNQTNLRPVPLWTLLSKLESRSSFLIPTSHLLAISGCQVLPLSLLDFFPVHSSYQPNPSCYHLSPEQLYSLRLDVPTFIWTTSIRSTAAGVILSKDKYDCDTPPIPHFYPGFSWP